MGFVISCPRDAHNHWSPQSARPLRSGTAFVAALILVVGPVRAAAAGPNDVELLHVQEQENVPPQGFTTPSGNIACAVFNYGGPPELSCEIIETTWTPERPLEECELDSGKQISMAVHGTASGSWWCAGDTWRHPGIKPLAYGKKWSSQGFSCISTKANLRCTNAKGHGWEMARAAVRIF